MGGRAQTSYLGHHVCCHGEGDLVCTHGSSGSEDCPARCHHIVNQDHGLSRYATRSKRDHTTVVIAAGAT